MKKRIQVMLFLCLTASVLSTETMAQCETRIHVGLANKVFGLKIRPSDFQKGNVFLTLDTIDAHDFNAPSDYSTYTSPKPLIRKFVRYMRSKKWDGGFYNYYELFNHPFYDSSLHQSFLVNDDNNTYKIDIWNSKSDTSKIEGLTVMKYNMKLKKTPY